MLFNYPHLGYANAHHRPSFIRIHCVRGVKFSVCKSGVPVRIKHKSRPERDGFYDICEFRYYSVKITIRFQLLIS